MSEPTVDVEYEMQQESRPLSPEQKLWMWVIHQTNLDMKYLVSVHAHNEARSLMNRIDGEYFSTICENAGVNVHVVRRHLRKRFAKIRENKPDKPKLIKMSVTSRAPGRS